MKTTEYILSIDQGTSGTRAGLVNHEGNLVGSKYQEIKQYYPFPGWVEQDPFEILESVYITIKLLMEEFQIKPQSIISMGIANQRESTVIWDKNSGKPIYNAIVWQCRRTTEACKQIKNKGLSEKIKRITGLTVDPYFSATKICWILDNVSGARELADKGSLAFGTIDSWLVWNLTKNTQHLMDVSNASRTMLFDINQLKWSHDILDILRIPSSMMPEIVPSNGKLATISGIPFNIPSLSLNGIAGDQQSALFGQCCFDAGTVKVTYGTGAFILINTGKKLVHSEGLLTTVAWSLDGEISYALEGGVFSAGSTIQWLRDERKIIETSNEIEELSSTVEDNGGVYFVPAFNGLGTPYWDPEARGTIQGLTRGSNGGHIAKAAIESIAFQCDEVINLMVNESKISIKDLKADGGASVNNSLMQFQSDISGFEIQRSYTPETTLLGAAYLSGIGIGFWKNIDELIGKWKSSGDFYPLMKQDKRDRLRLNWKKAVERSLRWVT